MIKKYTQRYRPIFWISVTSVMVVITLVVMGGLSWSGSYKTVAAFIPISVNTQTTNTVEGRNTLTSTSPWITAPTMTPLQSASPAPFQTSALSYLYLPIVEMADDPTPYRARLPLLTHTYYTSPASAPDFPVLEEPFTEKTILVDISDQHVYAFDGEKLIFSFMASTGRNNLTRPGHYRILDKIPRAYSDPWGFWMPYWMGIYYAGYNLENGFHSLPVLSNGVKLWGNKIGSPVTYGCVVLMPNDMKKLYRWASVGTAVVIRK